ncbi:MAG: hypothetical protein AB1529_07620 [Candidatus Micrarchaeota archaeon]
MPRDQLERTRMQRLRESLGANLSDARNQVNRFFGAKLCGACEGCSGGSCDKCKGMPAVSLWDAATSAPAIEALALPATEKPVAEATACKPADGCKLNQAPVVSLRPVQSPAQQNSPSEDVRLIHISGQKHASAVLRFSAESPIRAGLVIEETRPPPISGAGSEVLAIAPQAKSAREETRYAPVELMNSRGAGEQASVLMQIPDSYAPAGPKPEKSPFESQIPGEESKILIEPAAVPVPPGVDGKSMNLQPARQPQEAAAAGTAGVISENPCMEAILRMKYPKPANALLQIKSPAPQRPQQGFMALRFETGAKRHDGRSLPPPPGGAAAKVIRHAAPGTRFEPRAQKQAPYNTKTESPKPAPRERRIRGGSPGTEAEKKAKVMASELPEKPKAATRPPKKTSPPRLLPHAAIQKKKRGRAAEILRLLLMPRLPLKRRRRKRI